MRVRYDFEAQRREWLRVPLDGVGYVSTSEMASWTDDDLRDTVQLLERTRYGTDGWRNHRNRWRECLGLDSTHGKRVLDFGCGIGVESLQFAKSGNDAVVADINAASAATAKRVLSLWGYPAEAVVITGAYPFVECAPVDTFYCNGVLHHLPYAREVLLRAVELLRPGGDIRLMLYSDRLWVRSTGTLPAVDTPVEEHPKFQDFHCALDAVGGYADWYNCKKIEHRFGGFLAVEHCEYITADDAFLVAVLRPR
jgi:SAM-dependent methyltransferase